jgi:hypothetical protein
MWRSRRSQAVQRPDDGSVKEFAIDKQRPLTGGGIPVPREKNGLQCAGVAVLDATEGGQRVEDGNAVRPLGPQKERLAFTLRLDTLDGRYDLRRRACERQCLFRLRAATQERHDAGT